MILSQRLCDHTVLLKPLRMGDTVFDIGFNKGDFSAKILRYFDVKIIGLEPEPSIFYKSNVPSKVDLRNAALSTESGDAKLFEYRDRCASLYENRACIMAHDIKAITLHELLDGCSNGDVALLKLDIEGAEMDVLESAPASVLMRIPQITVEFHFRDFPDHKERFNRLCSRLQKIGFSTINFSRHDGADVLFFQEKIYRFPVLIKRFLYFEKWLSGFARVLKRILKYIFKKF